MTEQSEKPISNALYAANRTAPIVKVERKTTAGAPKRGAMPADAYRPRGLEDLPWRIRHRILRGMFRIFGPPTLAKGRDPLDRLARERTARYAHKATARPAS